MAAIVSALPADEPGNGTGSARMEAKPANGAA